MHSRKSIRLPGYDYSLAGSYFVTIVTAGRQCLFGAVKEGELHPSALGKIAADCWNAIPAHFPQASADVFVIMPNHVHGIITIYDQVAGETSGRGTIYRASTSPDINSSWQKKTHQRAAFGKPVPGSLPMIVGTFKAAVSRLAKRELGLGKIWQRNYYEHVIRTERDYEALAGYIHENPVNWKKDLENIK